MRVLLASLRLQLQLALRSAEVLQACLMAPLLAVVFLSVASLGGDAGLVAFAPSAIVAPALMALWTSALFTAGQSITEDRALGVFESVVASPAPLPVVLLGRMCAVTAVGLIAFASSWLTSGLVFGHWVVVEHPLVLPVALVATGLATATTAGLLAPLFLLTPSARTVQNTLTYPFYLLGGVLVPVTDLPEWLRPLGRAVFLSWSADLLRDTLLPAPPADPWARLGVVLALGGVASLIGTTLLLRVLHVVRSSGSLSHT
ncbi:ABC transporter permease [Umezawaea tangerina]|uniref:ABC-2 type transport system permease protein n=1 Tax=Umezawaea tangerina TaxID=84725 RepID=A0A2T0T492_9PSEU|nr:ABC transporter permease [Umezawaea tangerina]PRY40490.1 ABC-2 type transport system permease protein [Umezawaea tangerina]